MSAVGGVGERGDAGPAALRIAQLASLHCGEPTFDEALARTCVGAVGEIGPDLVVVAGDLTAAGYAWEYDAAAGWLGRISAPRVVVPGNHDSRNVGYVHFERHFGPRFSSVRQVFDPARAEHVGAPGVTVVGADSSEPDLDEGRIGRERYPWIREEFARHPDDLKLFTVHHHLLAVPGTGRGLNVITDAGDLLPVLEQSGVDVVLSGHKHVPYFWGLNGMLVSNAGTAATRRLRGQVPPSWTELEIDAASINVYVHYEDGRRELSATRSRMTRRLIREAFYLTEEFHASNRVLVT